MNSYLKKYARFPELIEEAPEKDLGIVVVIPCFNEPDISTVLNSLRENHPPENFSIEIILLINEEENSPQSITSRNEATLETANSWKNKNGGKAPFALHPL